MHLKKLQGVTGFQWQQRNMENNLLKHGVSPLEGEQLFFNQPLVVAPDLKHPQCEERFYALGRTDSDRFLFVVFTVRAQKLRIISARDMSRKERNIYGA